MRSTRSVLHRAALIGAATALFTGTLAPVAAQADPAGPAGPQAVPALAETAGTLVDQLGDRTAGSYLSGGRLTVTVTDDEAARTVRDAGAVPRLVGRGLAELGRVTTALDGEARIPGTAWAVDPATDQVVVTADSTVTGSRLDQLTAVARRFGDAARIRTVPGRISLRIAGGDAIYGGQYRCSLGFNVRDGSGTNYFLTAGHCGNVADTWYADQGHGTQLGETAHSTFPGHDYALVKDSGSVSPTGDIDLYNGSRQDITRAAAAVVGESVRRSGSTTSVHSGTVRALNATVNYEEGTVNGLIETDVCAEGGDSGGPLFDGGTALGLTSGGSGDCSFGGTTYFQPVTQALSAYGVSVY